MPVCRNSECVTRIFRISVISIYCDDSMHIVCCGRLGLQQNHGNHRIDGVYPCKLHSTRVHIGCVCNYFCLSAPLYIHFTLIQSRKTQNCLNVRSDVLVKAWSRMEPFSSRALDCQKTSTFHNKGLFLKIKFKRLPYETTNLWLND